MTYPETLDFLYTRLPLFSKAGADAIRPGLDNTIRLCEKLGNPERRFKSIHVAGTNGKGSTSHILAAVLQSAGYKTGLYTSPHLHDFRERIKVNGAMCDRDFVIEFTEKVLPLIEEINPSFFEITVAMAFEYFVLQKVDVAVIETGLGGRLDSTNVIIPELSVITNIGWDHMAILGDTLEKIAGEKAGIIKPHVPVVIGEKRAETEHVFRDTAREKSAPIDFATDRFYAKEWSAKADQLDVTVHDNHEDAETDYRLDLPGVYQTRNITTVLGAIHRLKQTGWNIPEQAIARGLHQAKKLTGLHGRWERIGSGPDTFLDVCHNPDGMRMLAEQIELVPHTQLHLVLGMVKDKDVESSVAELPGNAHYYFTKADTPRALDPKALRDITGREGGIYENVNDALKAALEKAQATDLVVICGSVFLVGEVGVRPGTAARSK